MLHLCSAICIYTVTFELGSTDSCSSNSHHVLLLHFLMKCPLYFPLDKLGEVHWDFKRQLHSRETEVRDAQPLSMSNLDVATAIAADYTFKGVSSTVTPNDCAACASGLPQGQLGSRRLMCSYKAMISPNRSTCCNWINRNRGLAKAWSWRDGSKSSGLKNQSGGPGTRLWTGKLWKRSTETGSWPSASLEVETMRSTVRGHPAQGWSLLTLKGPCSSGQSSVCSCQPKFSQIVLGSSQNRSRTVSLSGIEIRALRSVHTHL